MPRKQYSYHYLYKTTCTITDRFYYGMHSTSNLEDGYIGSGKRLWFSINKHGKENHSIEILQFFENRESLIQGETELITEDLLKDPMCMNLQTGGGGGLTTTEHRKSFHSAGARKTNELLKWRLQNDEDWTNNYLEKLSNAMKLAVRDGRLKTRTFVGKNHSEETKRKIGDANSIHQQGSNNSQFGKIWIHNLQLTENKKIQPAELDSYIKLGWIKGRKMKF